ncbi:MAG: GGDEF domain-containing protein [Huintestinicola sp.]
MGERKRIACIIANPEGVYQQRVLQGIFSRCGQYGYDVAVFSPLVQVCHFYKEYLNGELNIYELINYERFDGIIVVPITLTDANIQIYYNEMLEKIRSRCSKPVVAIDIPFGDYDFVSTNDREAFSAITRHILDVHKCKKIYFLTGREDSYVSEKRLSGYEDELKRRGMTLDPERVFYGDFWYTGGERLAERIISGELPIPDAIIAASDHMAIGAANRLAENGIKVPDQVIVTGYDATGEAVLNPISITTFIPAVSKAAANAIDRLRMKMEPESDILPDNTDLSENLCIGSSCGCHVDLDFIKGHLESSLLQFHHNFGEDSTTSSVDIGRLMDSYMLELLTGCDNEDECFDSITRTTYLLRPYNEFFLCLREKWYDAKNAMTSGYTEKMMTVIRDNADNFDSSFLNKDGGEVFDPEIMLPQLFEEREKASVFYFTPVHFKDDTLGYVVLRRNTEEQNIIGVVHRNWVRYINNALHMIRMRSMLVTASVHDVMTGMYNRRGMTLEIGAMRKRATPGDSMIVFVIDMDGLKHINDSYGHSEGDYGINAIASAAMRCSRMGEICVRAGGDEFYIIGIGHYTEEDAEKRTEEFLQTLAKDSAESGKPYELSASIGHCLRPFTPETSAEEIIRIADVRMYEFKTARKKQRKQ